MLTFSAMRPRSVFALSAAFALGFAAHAMLGTAEAKPASESPYTAMAQLGRVLTLVENDYVDPTDRTKLVNGAIEGMVDNLDPHSSYLPPHEYRQLQDDTEGKFAGIGVEVELREEAVIILATIEGSPAEHAGLKSGDRILAVDQETIKEIGYDKLVRRMRGAAGTHVKLTVVHPGRPDPFQVDVVRAEVHMQSVRGTMMPNGVAYVQMRQFQGNTHEEMQHLVAKLRAASPPETGKDGKVAIAGVLFDLRANPGGLVDQATAVADEFMESGTIYTMRHRGQIVESASAHTGGAFVGLPVVVLMNGYSASASELVAGALQDSIHATVVGTRSWGKGVVQQIIDLPGGAGMKLTVSRYYTPNGHGVQGEGISPDVLVTPSSDAGASIRESDLPNALASEGDNSHSGTHDAGIVVTYDVPDGSTPDSLVARDLPTDPRAVNDPVMRVGYETLLKKMGKR
jgi:carboxyl-terminal processing protease